MSYGESASETVTPRMLHVVSFTDELHGFYDVPLQLAEEMQREDRVVERDDVNLFEYGRIGSVKA